LHELAFEAWFNMLTGQGTEKTALVVGAYSHKIGAGE
jgi:hypothetical protein